MPRRPELREGEEPLSHQRLPYETHKAFAAFRAYCEYGQGRNLTQLAHDQNKSRQMMAQWSIRWHWQERLLSYENEQANMRREADATAALEGARLREERRAALKERLWLCQEKLADKFFEMMNFPVGKKKLTVGADGQTTIIMPGPWRFSDTVRMAQGIQSIGAFVTGLTNGLAHPGGDGGNDGEESLLPAADAPLPKLVIEVVHQTAASELPKEAPELHHNGDGFFHRS